MNRFKFDNKKHAYTLDSKPMIGTTTLIKELMPAPLAWWASGMALEQMGWTNPKYIKREEGIKIAGKARKNFFISNSDYYDWLQECYRNHDEFKKEAGEWGSLQHEKIEEAVKEAIKNGGYLKPEAYEDEAVERFASWGRGKKFIYSEVNVWSELLWLGGQADLIYQEDDKYYIADVKTSKSIYASQFIQIGLYDCQQSENGFYTAEGEKVGEPLKIEGYTVVNIPKLGGLRVETYRGTKQLREFGVTLVSSYRTLKELETLIK